MLRNSISAISFALLLILVSFTGCMDDSDSDGDDNTVIQTPDDTTSNDETETNTTEETPDVYDGPLRILALHGGGDTPEGLENQAGMQALMADLPEFEFFFADAPDDDSLCDQCWYADPPGGKDEPKIYYLVEYDIKEEEDRISVHRNNRLTTLWANTKK